MKRDNGQASVPAALYQRSLAAAAAVLLLLLWLRLLPALVGALSGFVLFRLVWGREPAQTVSERLTRTVLAALLLVGAGVAMFEAFELLLSASSDGLARLLRLMADTLDQIRSTAPTWLATRLPESAAAMQEALSAWLRSHAGQMQQWGRDALRVAFHLLIGLVIGGLAGASMRRAAPRSAIPRLAQDRWNQVVLAFSDILAAQLRISLVNTALTAVYLLVVLPMLDYRVPLGMTLVAFTFFAAFLPIVGNLLSNTAIVLAALTLSPWVAAGSLGYLLVIHKLEYFLNAHFVGSRVSMPPYALLVSMLVLESAFGAQGLIAAPIYCAWLTRELREGGWI
ncbi:MAG TPA: AI-2E family transporter [Ramlibacter sp.]|nr:AI-2E family transporter [Ramlibacter sp.]